MGSHQKIRHQGSRGGQATHGRRAAHLIVEAAARDEQVGRRERAEEAVAVHRVRVVEEQMVVARAGQQPRWRARRGRAARQRGAALRLDLCHAPVERHVLRERGRRRRVIEQLPAAESDLHGDRVEVELAHGGHQPTDALHALEGDLALDPLAAVLVLRLIEVADRARVGVDGAAEHEVAPQLLRRAEPRPLHVAVAQQPRADPRADGDRPRVLVIAEAAEAIAAGECRVAHADPQPPVRWRHDDFKVPFAGGEQHAGERRRGHAPEEAPRPLEQPRGVASGRVATRLRLRPHRDGSRGRDGAHAARLEAGAHVDLRAALVDER
eukprot:3804597-Prymnesium_polylepis.1